MFTSLTKKYHKRIRAASGVSAAAWEGFKKRRRQLVRMSVLSTVLTLASLAIVGTQLFYPFHMVIGVGIYILSFIPFGYRVYLSRDTWRTYKAYGLVGSFLKKERRRLFFFVLLLIVVAVFLWVRPLDERPFAQLSDQEIIELVEDDLYRSVTAMDYLETTGNDLLVTLAAADATANGTEAIEQSLEEFLNAVAFSESLTETHRYFASIPYRLWDQRLTSFLISYSLYVKKYELVHRILSDVSGDEHKKKALNHFNENYGRDSIYNELVIRFYAPKTRVRLSGGYLYERLFIGDTPRDDVSFTLLRDKSYGSYGYLKSNFGTTILEAPEVVTDGIEREMFDTWFPIQKVWSMRTRQSLWVKKCDPEM